MSPRLNFDSVRDLSDFAHSLNLYKSSQPFIIDLDTEDDILCILDIIISCPYLVERLKEYSVFKPVEASPDDLFVIALFKLRDTGDIDSLVRSLNWQQNDIAFLSNELKTFERTLVKLDESLSKIAKLRDDSNKLRKRNASLLSTISQLRNDKKTLKSIIYEIKKKNPCSNR